MTVDTSREAVEREIAMHEQLAAGATPQMRKWHDERAALLRALLARAEKAEQERGGAAAEMRER